MLIPTIKILIGFGSIPNTIKLVEVLLECLVSGLVYDMIKYVCKKGIDSMRVQCLLLFGLGVCDGVV